MVFTDSNFHDLMIRRNTRFGSTDVEFLVCSLPPTLRTKLDEVLDEASREQQRVLE